MQDLDFPSVDNLEGPLQSIIESAMQEIVQKGHYESAFLFTTEGLLIAHYMHKAILAEQQAIEISMLMNRVQRMIKVMGGLAKINEIVVEDEFHKKLVFRFLTFFSQPAILVTVIPPRKAYRGLTNKLSHLITQLEEIGA